MIRHNFKKISGIAKTFHRLALPRTLASDIIKPPLPAAGLNTDTGREAAAFSRRSFKTSVLVNGLFRECPWLSVELTTPCDPRLKFYGAEPILVSLVAISGVEQ